MLQQKFDSWLPFNGSKYAIGFNNPDNILLNAITHPHHPTSMDWNKETRSYYG